MFLTDSFKFAKGLSAESKSGRLECTKKELQEHLSRTDPKRDEDLPPFVGLKIPTHPGTPFDMKDLKKKEVDDFVRQSRTKGCPLNDGITYKVYKRYSKLRRKLFLPLRQMWRHKKVAERWCISEGVYLAKKLMQRRLGISDQYQS